MSKHTPGPWQLIETVGSVSVNAGKRTVIRYPYSPDFENRANARLIAAAPEMLVALIAVVSVADRQTTEFDAARAAIAKATGERQ